jgi:hypothetical protein
MGGVVAIAAVTRLRLADPAVLDDFFAAAVAVLEQAKGSAGCLGSDAIAEANDVWWTVTIWRDRDAMAAFVAAEPHQGTMAHLDQWCDEASFVDWEQDTAELPTWQNSYDRLIAGGQVAPLTNPSPDNEARSFPPPVLDLGH